jgi:hypothetical protein
MSFSLSGADRSIVRNVKMKILSSPDIVSGLPIGEDVKFQFPPRITDDSKIANWKEDEKATFEPLVTWMGSSARKISIEITYIVTGEEFTTKTIAEITRQFKAYFYRSIKSGSNVPIIKLRMYEHNPQETDFRLNDVSISYGETLIQDGAGIFPLLTKIKLGASLITQVNKKQQIPNLRNTPPKEWY